MNRWETYARRCNRIQTRFWRWAIESRTANWQQVLTRSASGPDSSAPDNPPGQDANEQLPWSIVYYQASDGTVPALEFLDGCPGSVDAIHGGAGRSRCGASSAVFRRGQMEAMHGTMGGWYEIRLAGPGREQLRLFCLLENGTSDELARRGLPQPTIAVITGCASPGGPCSPSVTTSACGSLASNISRTTRPASRPERHSG